MRPVDPYVIEVVSALFPGRGRPRSARGVGGPAAGALEWWVLPSMQRPRLLIPVGRRGAAVMLVRHGAGARRLARGLAASLIRSGVAGTLPLHRVQVGPSAGGLAADGIEDMLQTCLQTQVTVGVLLGPPRPNRKPVLQVFGSDGGSLAFVKVGIDPLTSNLVRREAEGLRRVLAAGLRVVEPPRLLHAGRVGELEVLVLAPLSSSQQPGRDIDGPPPLEAMAEVAGSQGTRTEVLTSSQFWVGTVHAAGEIPDPALRGRIDGVLDRFATEYGAANVVMGSWHGDWAPWNMGTTTDRVQVWDWERYSDGVPWGLDVAHFLSQRVSHASPSRAEQEQVLLRDLPDTLRRCGQQGRDQDPTIVLVAYLVTICLRFASVAGGSTPGRPNPRAEWAIALAERALAEEEVSG